MGEEGGEEGEVSGGRGILHQSDLSDGKSWINHRLNDLPVCRRIGFGLQPQCVAMAIDTIATDVITTTSLNNV